ncbi:MAG: cystathionine gamma-synthase, partial [Nocardioidaceae bacterium]|nr:cystathionine gamma-synthase [Nocardioidaceae bacterium]
MVDVTGKGFETRAIHAGQPANAENGAVMTPIYATSTYKQDGVGGLRGGYEYSRTSNPTRRALEECLAALEEGVRAVAFSSGMAAEDALLRVVCSRGDHVIIPTDAYGGTYRLVKQIFEPWGLDHTPAGGHDLEAISAALQPGRTRIIWIETPTNPLLGIADIAALATIAKDN